MTVRRAAFLLAAALLIVSAASLLVGLARLPALTLDECLTAFLAQRLGQEGFYTPHEMNTYTGPLYALGVARALALGGFRVDALRSLGAALNAAAFLLAAAHLRRRVSAEAAASWALLVAGSAYLLLKSRLAWEVYALQPLLLAVTLTVLDRPVTFPRALLFCAVTLAGVQNHFIYLSVPVSLCVLYGARAAWRGEQDARPMLRLAVAGLAAGAVLFLVKRRFPYQVDYPDWPRQRLWAVPLFIALAPAAAAAAVYGEWESPLVRLLARPALRLWGARALLLGLLCFGIWHAGPLGQILAGPVVWKRIFSWAAPWWLALPLHLWAAGLLGLLAWRAVRAWQGREALSAHERTLALWPAAYAAIFIIFRNTSSLRYYSLVQFLGLAGLAAALPRLPRPDRRAALGCALLAAVATQTIFWRELAAPGDRRPLVFKIGWHAENSWDFARKDGLFAAYDASGARAVANTERYFVAYPLIFRDMELGPRPADPSRAFDADMCRDCAAPPFYRWQIVAARPPVGP